MEKCFNIAGPCFPDEKSWDEKIYTRDEVIGGKTIHFIGL